MDSLKKDFHPSVLLPSLSAGMINAVILLSVEISFAALIFSGNLVEFLPRGIGIALLGTFISTVVVALTTSLPGMVSVPQDTPAALMGLVAASIAVTLKDRDPEVIYSTVIGAIIFGSLLTAAFYLTLGWFKASAFVRYVPYPVVGGFLAGTGYILSKGAFSVMVDLPLTMANLPKFFTPGILWLWLPGVVFGGALLLVLRKYNHFLITPAAVLLAIIVFYGYLFFAGISVQQAGANGWLLGPFPEGGLFKPFTFDNVAMIQWGAIFGHLDTFATLVGLSILSLLLNASGLEVIYKQDIDLDRELIAAGSSTLAGSLIGSFVSYQALGFSAMNYRFGARSRLSAIFTGIFFALILFFGASMLSYFPKAVLGGMLFLLGMSFLVEWLVDSFKTLPRIDYILIWVMLFIIAYIGFLQAIGAGVVIAALLFVISYGSLNSIRSVFSGDVFNSQVERSQTHKRLLAEKGGQIHILRLQGYLFFGTIQRLLQNIRARLADETRQPLKYLALDFTYVRKMDSSAVFGITRLKQLAEANGIAMSWTGLSEHVRERMKRNNLLDEDNEMFSAQRTLDYGLEWCENKLISAELVESKVDFVHNVLSHLSRSFPGLRRVRQYTEKIEIPAGEYFIQQGSASNDLFFIESGLVTVELKTAAGKVTRLRSVKSGATVGEVALYIGGLRSASVKAEKNSVLYRLSLQSLRKIEKEDPRLAAALHEWLGRMMAERIVQSTRTIEMLLD